MNKQDEKVVNDFCDELISLAKSLKEDVGDQSTLTAKWNSVDKFMMDIERLQDSQPITSRKSFIGLNNGKEVEGNTRYITRLSAMPIMVNCIQNKDGSLEPSEVSEMHIGNYDGEKVLLVTPSHISIN